MSETKEDFEIKDVYAERYAIYVVQKTDPGIDLNNKEFLERCICINGYLVFCNHTRLRGHMPISMSEQTSPIKINEEVAKEILSLLNLKE